MNDQKIKAASDEQLFQWMYNALATTDCIGHTKAHMNECRARAYRAELIERGHFVPEIDFWETFEDDSKYRALCIERGTYNGEGAH